MKKLEFVSTTDLTSGI